MNSFDVGNDRPDCASTVDSLVCKIAVKQHRGVDTDGGRAIF